MQAFKRRQPNRGKVQAADIIATYREAFNIPWWRMLLSSLATLLGIGGIFRLADASYREITDAGELRFFMLLEKDKTDLEHYVVGDFDCEVPTETAYALGLFFADGSCGLRDGKYAGAWWRIVGWKMDCLERAQRALEIQYPQMEFPIRLYDDYRAGSETNYGPRKKTLYCLEVAPQERHNDSSRGKFIEGFRATTYDQYSNKKVPAGILESPAISKKAFLDGVFDGDGTLLKRYRDGGRISCHGVMQTMEIIDLMHDCGWKFNFGRDNGDENYYIIFNRKYEKLSLAPACDDFAFRLYGEIHKDPELAAMPFKITWVSWETPDGRVGHAVISYPKNGVVKVVEPQNDDIYSVPIHWRLDMLCG